MPFDPGVEVRQNAPTTAQKYQLFGSNGFQERDQEIVRPPFGSNIERLLFSNATGGICLWHEEITILGTPSYKHYELIQPRSPLYLTDIEKSNIAKILWAECVLVADDTSIDKRNVVKYRADSFGDIWESTFNALSEIQSYNLPDSGKIYTVDESINRAGMVLGDGAVFEIKGRANIANFRLVNLQPGKNHKLYVNYYG